MYTHVSARNEAARFPTVVATGLNAAEPVPVKTQSNLTPVSAQKNCVLRVLLMQGHNNCVPHVLMIAKANEPRRSINTYLCIYPPPCLRHVVACGF